NLPKPVKLTSSPDFRAPSIAPRTASTAAPASFLLRPLELATRSTNSLFVTDTASSCNPSGDGWKAEANSGFGRAWRVARGKYRNWRGSGDRNLADIRRCGAKKGLRGAARGRPAALPRRPRRPGKRLHAAVSRLAPPGRCGGH